MSVPSSAPLARLLKMHVESEYDVVAARQRARQIAALFDFDNQDQVRIATAVSEIARNAFRYAGGGSIEFFFDKVSAPALQIEIRDSGNGIANLQEILDGRYQSPTGLGMGLIGTRRLMDDCRIHTEIGRGTTVTLIKVLPVSFSAVDDWRFKEIANALATPTPVDAFAEIQQQNQELLQTLADLRGRQEELLNLTRELEDTNRGVVALYAEIDEKAGHLRRADEMKSRFLSNMSHEFRTPVGSIRALSQLLLDHVDGDLSSEQEVQVRFIQKAATDLSELVNDLLDLAKIEAGKIEVKPELFTISDMFSALRGMLRPLLVADTVELIFNDPENVSQLYADDRKISQILRNFISNALKFTQRGSIQICANYAASDSHVKFSVIDTGIGIAEKDLEFIFEEFSQVENELQRHLKGTGLGLPLCRKLAALLGGYVEVQSTVGVGSTFSLWVPYQAAERSICNRLLPSPPLATIPVLVIEDHPPTLLLYEKFLQNTPYRALCARNLEEADVLWQSMRPRAVVLDVLLNGRESWPWLVKLKKDPANKNIPTIVASELAEKQKGMALGADLYYVKPLLRNDLLTALQQLITVTEDNSLKNNLVSKQAEQH